MNNKWEWAFNSATVMPLPWAEELKLWQEFGWRKVEIWWTKIEPCLQSGETFESLRQQMNDAGVSPIGMCPAIVWTKSEGKDLVQEEHEMLTLMDACAALGVPALTVCCFGKTSESLSGEYSYLAERLHHYAEQAQSRDLKISLEFIAGVNINGTLNSAIELVNAAAHPALGIVFDLCHYYASVSHFEDLERNLLPEKLFSVHIDDARRLPMEQLTGETRAFPGEGRIDIPYLMRRLSQYGYAGPWTVELYDAEIWKLDAREVFSRLNTQLRRLEDQLNTA